MAGRLTSGRFMRARLAAIALALAAVAPPSFAQFPPPLRAAPASASREVDPKLVIADMLARLAISRLRAVPDPSVADYRLAALTLRQIRPLRPTDADLVRLELEAWEGAARPDRLLEALRELVKLDPADTVAQLRLITSGIRALQTADDRLNAYLRLLGPKGERLDASIRSRLALDAALLARETGDEAAFVEFITRAAQLDATNKEAIALSASYFIGRSNDPVEKAKLLGDVVAADPTDPNAQFNLARGLMNLGAWKAAQRCMKVAVKVANNSGINTDLHQFMDEVIIAWRAQGIEVARKPIDEFADARQNELSLEYRRAQRRRELQEGETEPVAIIPGPLENARLAMALAQGNRAAAERSLGMLLKYYEVQLEQLKQGNKLHEGVSPEQSPVVESAYRLEALLARLYAGMRLDEAETEYATLTAREARIPLDEIATARFRAFLDVRACAYEHAIPVLEHLAEMGDLPSHLALAIAAEQRGMIDEAVSRYAVVNYNDPLSVLAAAAATRCAVLGRPLAPMPGAAEIDAYYAKWAPWMEGLVADPYAFISLRAELAQPVIDLFDRAIVRVTLRNVSKRTLSLGPVGTINSRLLFAPDLSLSARRPVETAKPEVLDLSRRLRLEPGQKIDAEFWPTRGSIGFIMMLYPTDAATIRWRLVQGFQVGERGALRTGPMCVTATTEVLQRAAIAGYPSVAELKTALRESSGRTLLDALVLMTQEMRRRVKDEPEAALAERLNQNAQAVAERMETMTTEERVVAIILMWHAGIFGTDAGKLIAYGARNDTSPYVRLALLHCAVLVPADPRLKEAMESADPIVSEFATAMRQSLIESGPYRHPEPEPVEGTGEPSSETPKPDAASQP